MFLAIAADATEASAAQVTDSLEALVRVDDVGVEALEVLAVAAKTLVRRGELQDLGDGAEVAALVVRQRVAGARVDDVEGVGRHDRRVDVAVVDQIADDLRVQQSNVACRVDKAPVTRQASIV